MRVIYAKHEITNKIYLQSTLTLIRFETATPPTPLDAMQRYAPMSSRDIFDTSNESPSQSDTAFLCSPQSKVVVVHVTSNRMMQFRIQSSRRQYSSSSSGSSTWKEKEEILCIKIMFIMSSQGKHAKKKFNPILKNCPYPGRCIATDNVRRRALK